MKLVLMYVRHRLKPWSCSLVVRHHQLKHDAYLARVDALERTWHVWAELGDTLTEQQWETATRCPGWDVAAVYAHHSGFPLALAEPPSLPEDPPEPVTAVDVLTRFNAPNGAAGTMAAAVADAAVSEAGQRSRAELVERFGRHGPQTTQQLRHNDPSALVPWPAAETVLTLTEALRIVLLEATVHLLDVQRALALEPDMPAPALRETVQVLTEMAPAIDYIEAATGRNADYSLPVLR